MSMKKKMSCGATGGGIYFLGFVGACYYFFTNAVTFGEGFVGLVKAIVWPAILVFEALKLLG